MGSSQREYLAGTKMRTKRDIKIFKEWLIWNQFDPNFETMPTSKLNRCLERFYIEVRSKEGKPYTGSTIIGIRASINRYFKSLPDSCRVSVIRDEAFNSSNALLERMWTEDKTRKKQTIKRIIDPTDLTKLMASRVIQANTPSTLVKKVWIDLCLHLGIKGKEATRALTKNSFAIGIDEHGHKYYRLNYDTEIRKKDTYSEMHDWHWFARMYEIKDSPFCPFKTMTYYFSKLSHEIPDFFQRPLENKSLSEDCWYSGAMGHNSILKMMSDISVEAGLSRVYTNICLKATISDLLEKQGLNLDTIKNKQFKGKLAPYHLLTSEEVLRISLSIHRLLYKTAYESSDKQ